MLWRGRRPSRRLRGPRVTLESRCHVGRVTSRVETHWCAQFMWKLGKREDWDEQEAAEKREESPIRRPDPRFRGASWTAVASEARRRFGKGQPRTEAPRSRQGQV